MNVFERYDRDLKIISLTARGFSNEALGQKYGLTTRAVQKIVKEWRETTPTLRLSDPLEIIDEMLVGYKADLEHLSELAEKADNTSAAVGAVNSRMAARDRIIALLQTTGVLPHDLGKLRIELDVRYIAQKLVTVLTQHGVPDEVQTELLAALQAGDLPVTEG
jgi:hypothetical protein